MELREFVLRVLLDNALKYDGQCAPGAAIGAVMREYPEMRESKEEVVLLAQDVASEVNALSLEEQQARLDAIGGSGAPEKEEQDPFDLDHENPVLRFEPSPSGPMHIGHAYPLGLNHLLAERNDGTLILRIADTNPDNIYEPAYELLEDDASWYTHQNVDEAYVQSDRMELYYLYAEKCLQNGWAYVCTCSPDAFRELIHDKTACPCRSDPPAEQLERWELMKTSYEPGDAVVRIKTDVEHKNPAMRDWPALRINLSEHPRQGTKYRVWPLMNFSVSVDDMEMGVTHTLRAKDHADNAKRQEWMFRYFDYDVPEVYNVGRINFTDLRLSTSETRKRLLEGEYSGWDDIRLPFLPALRRRGYQPEAFLRLADEMGISATDKTLSKEEYFTNIDSFNREIIDSLADRAYFVSDPVNITIEGAPTVSVEKDLHPDERPGGRSFTLGEDVIVSEKDLQDAEGVLFRLADGYNFRKDGDSWVFVSEDVEDYKEADKRRIIHYLPAGHDAVETAVHMPDGSWVRGVVEKHASGYDVDDLLQFERYGFVRLDGKDPLEFWYAHG